MDALQKTQQLQTTTFQPLEQCLNCGHIFEAEANFCLECGSKIQQSRFTFKRMLHEFGERVLNVDNSFFRTYLHLFTAPEKVINGFLGGLRKRYLNAFNYFMLAITFSGFQVFILKKFYPDALNDLYLNEFSKTINDNTLEYQPIVMFATIPILAAMAWLTFYTLRRHNYVEQLIIQLYTYSHLAFLSALLGIIALVLQWNYFMFSMLTIPFYIIYNAFVYKRVYKLSSAGLTKRTMLFLSILLISYIAFSIATALFFILLLGPEEFLKMSGQPIR